MCKPASMIVLKDRVLWGTLSESHEDIIAEHKIAIDGVGGPNGVRIELSPPHETDYDTPLDQWVFKVDQDVLPSWWDAEDAERRCRAELPAWVAAKVVLAGQVRSVNNGDHVVSVLGGTVEEVRGGTVQEVRGGTVEYVLGGTVQYVFGGTVQQVCGGTVQEVRGGTVQYVRGGTVEKIVRGMVCFFSSFSCKLSGSFAVVIDCTGNAAVCHVGTDTERVVSGGKNP